MGLLDKRKRSIAEDAARVMEPGETIEAMVMTQTNESADALATRVAAHNARLQSAAEGHGGQVSGPGPSTDGRVHALAATDRNVYAFYIPGMTTVGDVAIKVPLSEADAKLDGRKKVVLQGATFHVLFFAGKDAKALVEYVDQNG